MKNKNREVTQNPWMHYMRAGEFEEAWNFSDAVLASNNSKTTGHLPRHLQNIWNGNSLNNKKVLVRCYHGLGDTIQFIRYMPLLREIAAEVIVWAQPSLISLLKTVDGIDKLLPLHDGSPEVEFDIDVEIMELPHIFRTTLETIPSNVPYFNVKQISLSSEDKNCKVGLVWRAGDWDERRSIPFSFLTSLFRIKNINFYVLQADAKAAGWQEGYGINPGEFDLYNYAKVIKGLDLMISVDSMPAHLAGALGVPVWNLLQKKADWRWMENRDDSPWYPTMRLFRQKEQGEWKDVIKKIEKELEKSLTRIND